MSEYWVSKKKYFCKYCETYIADDAPSRQHHENGMRHKGNVERFIRGIYKAGEKQKKDSEEEKREMKRVELAAAAAFAQDVGSGLAKAASGPVASTSAVPKKPLPKPSNPYANYSTAESLGYSDPDAERIAAELEARRSQGIAGEWQVLDASSSTIARPNDATTEAGVKREAEAPPLEEDLRSFKLRKKTVNTGLGELYDPGLIPIKIKKKEVYVDPVIPAGLSANDNHATEGSTLPKWNTIYLKPAGDTDALASTTMVKGGGVNSTPTTSSSKWSKPQWDAPLPDFKQEERETMFGNVGDTLSAMAVEESTNEKPHIQAESNVKPEDVSLSIPPSQTGGSMFKKRKAPANAGKGRREI